jgi:cytochrome c
VGRLHATGPGARRAHQRARAAAISYVSIFIERSAAMKTMMNCGNMMTAILVASLAYGTAWAASEHAGAKDAEAMVKKGISFIKSNGKDKGYTEITNKQGPFIDRDLYLVVYQLDGKVLAHGANEKMVGRVLIDLKDIDGKEFVRERVELGKAREKFWQDYKFTNPVTKKVEPKSMYCERLDDTVVCGGVYKG